MKVIFLDIDGVLCTMETYYRRKKEFMNYKKYISPIVDTDRLLLLKQIIDKTSAKVVITSSWRTDIISGLSSGIELINLFKEYGIEIYDLTPFDDNRNRVNEINSYLEQNEIENYIIIDDECISLECFSKHLLRIKNDYASLDKDSNGLLECNVQQAIDLLNKDKKLELI